MPRLRLAILLSSCLVASHLRAADADVRILELQVEIDRRLLQESARRWSDQLQAEERAAQALQSAVASVQAALSRTAAQRGSGEAPLSLQAATAALVEAERAVAGTLAASQARAVAFEQQSLRLSAQVAALEAMRQRGAATPLDGAWELALQGGGRGRMNLTQVGTLVTGDYALEGGSTGSLTGTFAAGRLRLERVDAVAGRDAVLEGTLVATGLEGTWLSTIFGRGTPEAGSWTARRAVPPAVPETADTTP